jgi:hypothetical protein
VFPNSKHLFSIRIREHSNSYSYSSRNVANVLFESDFVQIIRSVSILDAALGHLPDSLLRCALTRTREELKPGRFRREHPIFSVLCTQLEAGGIKQDREPLPLPEVRICVELLTWSNCTTAVQLFYSCKHAMVLVHGRLYYSSDAKGHANDGKDHGYLISLTLPASACVAGRSKQR